MNDKEYERRVANYKQSKLDKIELRERFPNRYTQEETLAVLSKMYLFIKSKHFDIPKLQKKTLEPYPKGKSIVNSGYCDGKRIKIAHRILTRRADVTSILDYKDWKIQSGTFMLAELVTHEMSHIRIKNHRKGFYIRQRKLFATIINGIISGEYYK